MDKLRASWSALDREASASFKGQLLSDCKRICKEFVAKDLASETPLSRTDDASLQFVVEQMLLHQLQPRRQSGAHAFFQRVKQPVWSSLCFGGCCEALRQAPSKAAMMWSFLSAVVAADVLSAVAEVVTDATQPAALCKACIAVALARPLVLGGIFVATATIAEFYGEFAFLRDPDATEQALGLLHAVYHTRARDDDNDDNLFSVPERPSKLELAAANAAQKAEATALHAFQKAEAEALRDAKKVAAAALKQVPKAESVAQRTKPSPKPPPASSPSGSPRLHRESASHLSAGPAHPQQPPPLPPLPLAVNTSSSGLQPTQVSFTIAGPPLLFPQHPLSPPPPPPLQPQSLPPPSAVVVCDTAPVFATQEGLVDPAPVDDTLVFKGDKKIKGKGKKFGRKTVTLEIADEGPTGVATDSDVAEALGELKASLGMSPIVDGGLSPPMSPSFVCSDKTASRPSHALSRDKSHGSLSHTHSSHHRSSASQSTPSHRPFKDGEPPVVAALQPDIVVGTNPANEVPSVAIDQSDWVSVAAAAAALEAAKTKEKADFDATEFLQRQQQLSEKRAAEIAVQQLEAAAIAAAAEAAAREMQAQTDANTRREKAAVDLLQAQAAAATANAAAEAQARTDKIEAERLAEATEQARVEAVRVTLARDAQAARDAEEQRLQQERAATEAEVTRLARERDFVEQQQRLAKQLEMQLRATGRAAPPVLQPAPPVLQPAPDAHLSPAPFASYVPAYVDSGGASPMHLETQQQDVGGGTQEVPAAPSAPVPSNLPGNLMGARPRDRREVELWENERRLILSQRYSGSNLLPTDRENWSDEAGKPTRPKELFFPPPGWEWDVGSTWDVNWDSTTDDDGWQYAKSFNNDSWHSHHGRFDFLFVRRRRWTRTQIQTNTARVTLDEITSSATASTDNALKESVLKITGTIGSIGSSIGVTIGSGVGAVGDAVGGAVSRLRSAVGSLGPGRAAAPAPAEIGPGTAAPSAAKSSASLGPTAETASLLPRFTFLPFASKPAVSADSEDDDGFTALGGEAGSHFDPRLALDMLPLVLIPTPVVEFKQGDFCSDCGKRIPVVDADNKTEFARQCALDGQWYCFDCHTGTDLHPIPAAILFEADNKPRPVSRRSFWFLNHIKSEAIFNVCMMTPHTDANHHVRALCAKLEELSGIRSDLKDAKSVLDLCPAIDKTALVKLVWPREHLWEEATMYTLQDLVEACYGVTDMTACESLKPLLLKLCRFCRKHAQQCAHCRVVAAASAKNADAVSVMSGSSA